jgi:hypothetical protein
MQADWSVDTWGGLRQLAQSADQTLSPAFIKSLLRRKSGVSRLLMDFDSSTDDR